MSDPRDVTVIGGGPARSARGPAPAGRRRPEPGPAAAGRGWWGAAPPAATGDFGIKAHFVDVAGPRDTIELFGTAGHYGGLAAIEGDRWNAAFTVPAELLR